MVVIVQNNWIYKTVIQTTMYRESSRTFPIPITEHSLLTKRNGNTEQNDFSS